VKAGAKHMSNAANWYKKAKAAAAAADAERKAEIEKRSAAKKPTEDSSSSSDDTKQQPEAAAASAAAVNGQSDGVSSDGSTTLSSHCQVLHGNSLYEWSQLLAAVGDSSWKAVLDEASDLFRAAGCAEKDIRNALKNHTEVGVEAEGGGERGRKYRTHADVGGRVVLWWWRGVEEGWI